jgi:hypothetical protein
LYVEKLRELQKQEIAMLPASSERVATHTSKAVERRLQHEFEDRLAYFAGHPGEIESRLKELDREWDIERAIEANASMLALAGVVLGAGVDRRWLALTGLVTGFLLQHSLQGWCPPVPVLRQLGFRTAREIERERYALKALRGDFDEVRQAENRIVAVLRAIGGSLVRGRKGS